MEYVDFSKYFATYTPLLETKKDNTVVDFNTAYSNLDWNTPLPQFPDISIKDPIKFSDLFDSSFDTYSTRYSTDSTLDPKLERSINNQLGKRYVFGGNHQTFDLNSPVADCSSFVAMCYRGAYNTAELNGTALTQYQNSQKVLTAKPGDLIFFKNTSRHRASGLPTHVGIITKVDENGNPIEMAHASSSHGTLITSLNTNYWKEHFLDVRRPKLKG